MKQPRTRKQPKQKTARHTRVNHGLLTPLERPALAWLSERMPAWVSPDLLTALGFLGSLVIFAGYVLTSIDVRFMWLASFGLVINWFGDSLDGTLARFRKIERPRYGYFIDHAVDSVAEALVFIGLGFLPMWSSIWRCWRWWAISWSRSMCFLPLTSAGNSAFPTPNSDPQKYASLASLPTLS